MTSSGSTVCGVEPVEQPPQPADLMLDLGVGAAHRGGRVGAAQGTIDQRDQEFLVGAFVREQFAFQPVEQGMHRVEVAVVGGQGVGDSPDLLDHRQHGVVLGAQA